MFNWKVEEMKLMNSGKDLKGRYFIEDEVTREDKIAFVDSMQDGKLSYIIAMIKKFETEKDSMPKDQWGSVKTVSLKAWLKRNDTKYLRPIFNRDYNYGWFYLLGVERSIQRNPLNHKGSYYDTYYDLIDEVFHKQILLCVTMERNYFLKHDEYSILKNRFEHLSKEYNTTFNIPVGFCSDGKVFVYELDDEEKYKNRREITIEELKILIPMYDRLDMFIQELSNEMDIHY